MAPRTLGRFRTLLLAFLGLMFCFAPTSVRAQVTGIDYFTGDDSESFESFLNYNSGGFHFLASPAPILNRTATITNTEMIVYDTSIADLILGLSGPAQPVDGNKGLGLDALASTATIDFSVPALQFGAYWGAYTPGMAATVFIDFYDTKGARIDSVTFDYDRSWAGDGALEWHGWLSPVPIGKVVITGDYVAMDALQSTHAFITLSGTLELVGIDSSAPAQTLQFDLRTPGTTTTVVSRSLAVGPDGRFTLTTVPRADYDLAIQGSKYLRRVIGDVAGSTGNISGLTASLLPGDINGDNVIELDDLVLFFDAYGSVAGDANYDPLSDMNGDGAIELTDLVLFFDDYGLSGDP